LALLSIVDLTAIVDVLASCQQEIAVHVEVVAMNSIDEDLLVADHASFLHNFINNPKKG
jgi:hypothetical protein